MVDGSEWRLCIADKLLPLSWEFVLGGMLYLGVGSSGLPDRKVLDVGAGLTGEGNEFSLLILWCPNVCSEVWTNCLCLAGAAPFWGTIRGIGGDGVSLESGLLL